MKRTAAPAITPRITPDTKVDGTEKTVRKLFAAANGYRDFGSIEDERSAYAILCAYYPKEHLKRLDYAQMGFAKQYGFPRSYFGESYLIKKINQRHENDGIVIDQLIADYAREFMEPLSDYERSFIKLAYGFKTGFPYTAQEISDYYLFDGSPLSKQEIEQIIDHAEKVMRMYAETSYLRYVGYCEYYKLRDIREFYSNASRTEEKLIEIKRQSAENDQRIDELKQQLFDAESAAKGAANKLSDMQRQSAEKDKRIAELEQQLAEAKAAKQSSSIFIANSTALDAQQQINREMQAEMQILKNKKEELERKLANISSLEQQYKSKSNEVLRLKAQLIEARRKLKLISEYGHFAVTANDHIFELYRARIENATLKDLDLSVRAYNILAHAGCKTVADVRRLIRNDSLKNLGWCGPKTVENIIKAVNQFDNSRLNS